MKALLKITTTLSLLLAAYTMQSQVTPAAAPNSVMVQVHATHQAAFLAAVRGDADLSPLLSSSKSLNSPRRIKDLHPSGKSAIYLLEWDQGQDIDSVVEVLKSSGTFAIVEPNYIGEAGGRQMVTPPTLPDDRNFDRQWSLRNDGSFTLSPATARADIDITNAWDIETGSSDIVVAVLDSGDPATHRELRNRLWSNETSINGTDDDGNGYIDDTRGYNFVDDDPFPVDNHGHGSNVAGIIVAEANNNNGFSGVDWQCKLMTLKVLDDDGFGFYSDWAEAIFYAVDNGAHVINMSLGGVSYSQLLQNAVNYATDRGVLVVACMMNDNTNAPRYPAALDNVLSVGSTDPDDTRTRPFFWASDSGSNWGPHIDLVAPGNYIYGLHPRQFSNFNTYWGGTSQAAPHVAGVATLLLAQDNTRTPADLIELITSTADDVVGDADDVPGYDLYYGHGRLNAYRALEAGAALVSTTAVEEDSAFEVTPNPVVRPAPITISTTSSARSEVSIYDMSGQRISVDYLTGRQMTLATDDLELGMYIIRLAQDNGKHSTRRIVVQ
jgi:subtilisin family serine protease